MSINNLPASIATAIQQGYLEREFRDPLTATLAYRSVAQKETFPAHIGETYTKTRRANLAAVTTPVATASNTDLNNGLTSEYFTTEQFVMTMNQYSATTDLNMIGEPVAIASVFLQNARALGEQAARSVETLAQQALWNVHLGQNTRVVTTLGAAGTTVAVDDIRGFGNSWTTNNVPVAVSSSNPLAVTFIHSGAYSSGANSTNTTGGTYNCIGVTADGSNVSTTPGGISGTLTFSSNVAIVDGTAGNAVVASVAPAIMRPFNRATSLQLGTGDVLTSNLILQAVAQMQANGVRPFANGFYRFITDYQGLTGLFNDTAFQRFNIGQNSGPEYLRGTVGRIMNVEIVASEMTPIQNGIGSGPKIHRATVLGDGALVESDYTGTGYDNVRNTLDGELVSVMDSIAHVTRPPLDRLGQVITQSWTYIGGFVVPTDITTNTQTIPTANNSAWKRGLVVEYVQA